MQRRDFLTFTGLLSMAIALRPLRLLAGSSSAWRTAELTFDFQLEHASSAHLWVPMPLTDLSYQEVLKQSWTGDASHIQLITDPVYSSPLLSATWTKAGNSHLQIKIEVKMKDRLGPDSSLPLEKELYLKPTSHVPLDGVVQKTAAQICGLTTSPDEKARLIYDWIIDHTFRDAKVRGCGQGDVASLLASGAPGGKCADLSSLFVGLCRASGVPAREAFGLRVGPSVEAGSLGLHGDVSKAQHCRAEFMSSGGKWVPVDPADVRKVILEEKLTLDSKRVQELRQKFFGFWEMNWLVFNHARDLKLDGLSHPVNYLMYPLLISGKVEKDGFDPTDFRYQIISHIKA